MSTDLQTIEYDIPIPLNQRVLAFVELFQGRLHDFLEEGMRRGSKYLPMIQNVFRAEGLPLDLAYVPLVESAFKPNALSRTKAKGVWQFMRGTGLENGLRQDWYIDERSDPGKGHRCRREVSRPRWRSSSTATGIWRWRLTTADRVVSSTPSSWASRRLLGLGRESRVCCPARPATTCR